MRAKTFLNLLVAIPTALASAFTFADDEKPFHPPQPESQCTFVLIAPETLQEIDRFVAADCTQAYNLCLSQLEVGLECYRN